MDKSLVTKNENNAGGLGLLAQIKKRFQGKRVKAGEAQRFGRTVGVVWEFKSWHTGEPVASIVQIERAPGIAKVTVFDGNDPSGTSATNLFEHIASGVYLEHLAGEYLPHEVQFIHCDTLPIGGGSGWGRMPVQLAWNKGTRSFERPAWGQWKADIDVPESERLFIQTLRSKAGVEVERYMKELDKQGELTARERELYRRYQEHISEKSELYRYNLRGGWLFAPSRE